MKKKVNDTAWLRGPLVLMFLWSVAGCHSLRRDYEEETFRLARSQFTSFHFEAFDETLLPLILSPKVLWRQRAIDHLVPVEGPVRAKVVSVLRESLSYDGTAAYALKALARFGVSGTSRRIIGRLGSESEPSSVVQLLRGLAYGGGASAQRAALRIAGNEDPEIRAAALEVLAASSAPSGAVSRVLRQRLADRREDPSLRLLAAKGLARRHQEAGLAYPWSIIARCADGRQVRGDPGAGEDLAARAAICLGHCGRREARGILSAARGRAPAGLAVIIDGALAMLGDGRAYDRVAVALGRRDLRGAAIEALREIGDERAHALLSALVDELSRGKFKDMPAAVDYQSARSALRRRGPHKKV